MKKTLLHIIAAIITLSMVFTFIACVPDDGKVPPTPKPKLEPLPDIIDYSSATKYYSVQKATYDSEIREREVGKIDAKIAEKNSTETDKKVTIALDDSTVKKIFYNSTGEGLMLAIEKAALPQDKMIELVDYLTKEEGGFIDDYEKLEDLQDEAEADSNNNAKDKKMQLHRYDMAQKIIDIFQEDGDQFARMAYEAILYAQTVVVEMHNDYKTNKANFTDETPSAVDGSTYSHILVNDEIDTYFKYALKDYDTSTYIFAFNETNNGAGKKELIKLYGYYYHYEKTNHDVFPRDLFEERLDLSYLDTMTDNQAKRYRDLNQLHYAKVYRYTDSFYKKYNTAHFTFQQKIEIREREFFNVKKEDYNFEDAAFKGGIGSYGNSSYSDVMRRAIDSYIASDLKIGDVNYEYTSVDNNVLAYNTKRNAWENCDQDALENEIIKVNLEVEQLKSQDFALGHDSLTKTGNQNDFSNALRYQIRSYQSDYLRGIQASKKNIVLLYDDLYYYTNIYSGADKETKIEETLFEIGRESVIQKQVERGLDEANVDGETGQMSNAASAEWNTIKTEIEATIKYDYSSINAVKKGDVTGAFENMLVKRQYDCGTPYFPGENSHNCKRSDKDSNYCAGLEKKFDTQHRISRLADTHQLVLYYSSNQVILNFQELDEATINSMKINTLDTGFKDSTPISLGAALKLEVNNKLVLTYKSLHQEYIDAGEDLVANNLFTIASIDNLNIDKSTTDKYAISFTAETKANNEVWYLDANLVYPVRITGDKIDNFSFNMKLYPGYMISKVAQKA